MRRSRLVAHLFVFLLWVSPVAAQTAREITRPSYCPPPEAWEWRRIDDPAIWAYDHCYAVDWNYDLPRVPDIELANGVASLRLSASQALSPASLKHGTRETLNSPGHGSAMTFHIHPVGPDGLRTECFNPTQEGSELDDTGQVETRPDGWYARGQMHMGSSSKILGWGSGVLNGVPWSRSISQLAYYIPDGHGGWNNCEAHLPSVLSEYVVDQQIFLTTAAGGAAIFTVDNALSRVQVDAGIYAPQLAEVTPILDAVWIAYFLPLLGPAYTHPAGCVVVACLVLNTAPAAASGAQIVASADGTTAVGLVSTKPLGAGAHPLMYTWTEGAATLYDPRRLQTTWVSKQVPRGTLKYRSYLVVGTLAEVTAALGVLVP